MKEEPASPTVKRALAKSPLLPVTVIVLVPAPATTKEAEVIWPLDIEHEGVLTATPVIEPALQVSVGLNPPPKIVTIAPGGATLEERIIVGVLVVTVKMA